MTLKTSDSAFPLKAFPISSKWVFEGEHRFGAGSYIEGAFEALDEIERSGYEIKRIRDVVENIYHPTQSQPRSNFKRIWVKPGCGEPFLSGRDLFFFRPEKKKWVSTHMEKIDELKIPRNTILLTRSGSTGHPVLVSETLSKFAITDDALRIFPSEFPVGYVYAFLATSQAYTLITKNEYGATVPHLEAKHISNLPIPIADKENVALIHNKVMEAYQKRDKANSLLDKAEEQLYTIVGIDAFEGDSDVEYLSDDNSIKAFSQSFSNLRFRFDPKNHVPLVRSALNKLRSGAYELQSLGQLCEEVYIPARFKREYVQQGYGKPYLLPSQLPTIRPFGIKELSNRQAKANPEYLLKKDQVIISTDGTVGRVDLVSDRRENWFGSNNMARVSSSKLDMGFVYLFLSTPYGQHQLKKDIYGGVVDHINEKHISDILLPLLKKSDQKKIGRLVRQAIALRDEAAETEEKYVSLLEELIRKNSLVS